MCINENQLLDVIDLVTMSMLENDKVKINQDFYHLLYLSTDKKVWSTHFYKGPVKTSIWEYILTNLECEYENFYYKINDLTKEQYEFIKKGFEK